MASSSVLSQTLQSITVTKIRELEKQRNAFSKSKAQILASSEHASSDIRASINALLEGVKKELNRDERDLRDELDNIGRWVDQSAHDPTVPEATLRKYEHKLKSCLDNIGTRLDFAHLYSRLLIEWIEAPAASDDSESGLETSGSDESFELVQNTQRERLEQLREKFARVVFDPLETDEVEIDQYLMGLFKGEAGEAALKQMRDSVSFFGESMLLSTIDLKSLKWCIQALLKNQLLNDEKTASLNDFLKDEAVLNEICDVLNMRLKDLSNWDWNLGDEGMPVVPYVVLIPFI